METQVIKSGWIEKRSHYIKKWRKRWLVLWTSSLSTYKSESEISKPTMNILLSEILDASPYIADSINEFSFMIATPDEKYLMRASNDGEMCNWLNIINYTKQGNRVSSFGSPTYYHESKVLSDKSLITSFCRMKEQIFIREDELLKQLDEVYTVYVEKATQEYKEISKVYEEETRKYETISGILENSTDLITKIRNIQRFSIKNVNFSDLDSYNLSKLQVSIQEDTLERLVKSNIKVCLGNPSEVMIRRTSITRALKWRYTGQKIDALTFSVNKDIKLTAIGICTPYKPGRTVFVKDFQILKGGCTNSASVYHHSSRISIQINPENSIHKIVMEKSVLIKSDHKYTLSLLLEGAHTYKCVDCISNVEGPDRVIWSFFNAIFSNNQLSNRCDTVCGPIADFYFMVVS